MMVDVHGDEELPYVFIAGNAGIPEWGSVQNDLQVCERAGAGGTGIESNHVKKLTVWVSALLRVRPGACIVCVCVFTCISMQSTGFVVSWTSREEQSPSPVWVCSIVS